MLPTDKTIALDWVTGTIRFKHKENLSKIDCFEQNIFNSIFQTGGQGGQDVAPGHVKLVKRGNKMEVLL